MIATFLVEHRVLVPGALVLVAVGCAAVGAAVLRSPARDRLLRLLTGLSLLPVAALTLSPTRHHAFEVCAVQFSLPTLGSAELLANVALFVPPVLFAALAIRRPLLALAGGAALSAVVEALQAAVPVLGRSCDTNDWAMNTAGAVLGALLAVGVSRLRGPRSRGGPGGPATPAAAPGPGGSGSAPSPA